MLTSDAGYAFVEGAVQAILFEASSLTLPDSRAGRLGAQALFPVF